MSNTLYFKTFIKILTSSRSNTAHFNKNHNLTQNRNNNNNNIFT